MERANRAPVSTFYAPGAWGETVSLDEASAHHAAVKRLSLGDHVRLTSGDGRRAIAKIETLGKDQLEVRLLADSLEHVVPPPSVSLWAPIGDRERMLWLAEKSVELGLSSWRSVLYRRSRSVNPRGEGPGFRDKLRLRMIAALEQGGSAWLPVIEEEINLAALLERSAGTIGVLLDQAAPPLIEALNGMRPPLTIALGPEGGLEEEERQAILALGWRGASLADNVLRFETAGLAALAITRSHIGPS